MNDERWATIIKIAAVAVAAPRWIGALLEAEGVPLPAEWRAWWVIFSAVCAAGMALVEAGAFAYCLRAWRGMSGRSANIMALMIGASAVTFVIVLSPYIAANVSKQSMSTLLTGWALLAWSVAVALSTILIIASVGYAQKRPVTRTVTTTAAHDTNDAAHDARIKTYLCPLCAEGFGNSGKLAAHMRWKHANHNGHDTTESAVNAERVV
jgi:hypothetical protein